MSVDVFGRSLSKPTEQIRGLPGQGFRLTEDGDYDMTSKILRNVADAREKTDAVNLGTVERLVNDLTRVIIEHYRPMIDELNRLISEMQTTIAESLKPIDTELNRLRSEMDTTIAESLKPIDAELGLLKSTVGNLELRLKSKEFTETTIHHADF